MYKITVNNVQMQVEASHAGKIINGRPFVADIIEIKEGLFHILQNNRSLIAEVIESNFEAKTFLIKVNNHEYNVSVKDKYDELLHEMGFDSAQMKKSGDVKAPMPGLVLSVNVSPGQQIRTGDSLVILEAMKMENVLKAHADGVVKKIFVIKGDKVEKNQVMVTFE
jgi:acetyl/propionyl-CoA carboxylase alpha subunit